MFPSVRWSYSLCSVPIYISIEWGHAAAWHLSTRVTMHFVSHATLPPPLHDVVLMALSDEARLRWSCCDIFCQTKFWDSFINYTTCPPPTHKCLWQVCSSRSWDSDTLVNESRRAFTEVIPHMKLKYLFITFPILGQNSSLFPNFHQVFAPTVFLLMFPHHHPTWKILDHFQMKLPNINCRYQVIIVCHFILILRATFKVCYTSVFESKNTMDI